MRRLRRKLQRILAKRGYITRNEIFSEGLERED
jgi:hypothetical protein